MFCLTLIKDNPPLRFWANRTQRGIVEGYFMAIREEHAQRKANASKVTSMHDNGQDPVRELQHSSCRQEASASLRCYQLLLGNKSLELTVDLWASCLFPAVLGSQHASLCYPVSTVLSQPQACTMLGKHSTRERHPQLHSAIFISWSQLLTERLLFPDVPND